MSTKTNLNEEYFVIGRVNNNNYPLLVVKQGGRYERECEYVDDIHPMLYRLGEPVPPKPIMVDFHSSSCSIVSQKIGNVLGEINIKGLQLIPATIEGKNNELYENYCFLNIYNKYPALDMDKSVYSWDDFLELANPIEKIVLNEEFLNSLPLEERLIFRLKENSVFEIYHKSVVDTVMAINPEGILFTKVSDWSMGTPFS